MKKKIYVLLTSAVAATLIATLTGCGHNCVTYGDGVMLYRSTSVNLAGAERQEFNLDVAGVQTLKVVINGKNFIRLVNASLTLVP